MFVEHGLEAITLESLEGLIAWLEMQPSDGQYDWPDIHGCLVCKYFQAKTGLEKPAEKYVIGAAHMFFSDEYHYIARTLPWTFGASLDRAKAALAAR